MIRTSECVRLRKLTGWRALSASFAGAVVTAVCAQAAFHLPGNPVPVTMQTFAVVACAMLLGGRLAAIAQLEYLALGVAGVPVFAGLKAGPAALAGPTGGYLVGFVVAAFIVGTAIERAPRPSFSARVIAGMLGILAIYVLGRAWFALWLGDVSGLMSWAFGVAPFVAVDAVKVVLAAQLCGGLRR